MESNFQWDPEKERRNQSKHGVSFTEAVTVLEDEYASTIEDDHPTERRFITMGMAETGRILVVVYSYRGEAIRIISARLATPRERNQYGGDR
jgi:hypothetical protein